MRTRVFRPRYGAVTVEALEPRRLFSGGHPPPPAPVVTFSNTDGTINPTSLDLIGSMVGDQFTPAVTGTLDSATIAISHPFATGSSVAGISVYNESPGAPDRPGARIAFTTTTMPPTPGFSFAGFAGGPVLVAGHHYWLAVSGNDISGRAHWSYSNTSGLVSGFFEGTGGPGQLATQGAFRVSVIPTAVPPMSRLTVVPPAIFPGKPFTFTISAQDASGNLITDYTGTVHFAALAADTRAVLPADYTFTAADGGFHTFTATLFLPTSIKASPFLSAQDAAAGVTTVTPVIVYPTPGDANRDGYVNFADLLTLAQNYGKTNAQWAIGDFNSDLTVNFADLLLLAQHYNNPAGAARAGTGRTGRTRPIVM